MKVPLGDFGFRTGQPATGGRVAAGVPLGAFGTGDALADLGRAGAGVAGAIVDTRNREAAEAKIEARRVEAERKQLQAQEDAEYKRNEEQARRNGTNAKFAQYQVDLTAHTTDVQTRLDEGLIDRPTAEKEWTDGIAKLRTQHIDGLDQLSKDELGDNLIRFNGAAAQQFRGALQKNAKQERTSTFTTAIEALERLATTDRVGALKQAEAAYRTEGTALFGADTATKQMQGFRERVAVTDYSNQILGAKNNVKALSAVEQRIQAEPDLDPDKKSVLTARVVSIRETLLAKADRAEQSRLRTVERTLNSLTDMTLKGYEPTVEQLLPAINAAKGTELEGQARNLVETVKATAAFRSMAPAGQEAFLTDFETKVRKNPTKGNVEALEKLKTIHGNQKTEAKNDPITFAARKGLAEVQPLDLSKPATLGDQLAARLNIAGGMKARYGSPLQVLTTEESSQLSQFLRDAPVDQKRTYLAQLSQALPNAEAFGSLMGQIAPDNPVLAVAGIYAGRAMKTNQGREVSDYILRGQAALNPPTKEDGKPVKAVLPMPPDKDLLTSFNSYERDAFAGREQARNAYFQSARAIYAARAVEAGDYTGEFNSRRWESAMALATGGIEKYKGRAIVMPYGTSMSDFRDQLKTRTDAIAKSGVLDSTVTAYKLRDMPLENQGDGRYVFRAGDGVLVGKDGKPVVVDFNQPVSR